MQLAITADLHWGTAHAEGNRATERLVAHLRETPPDVLVLAGDIGAGEQFEACLELFDELTCRKALVPGNHDIWVRSDDERGDSLDVYDRHLPQVAREHGFDYLDAGPLLIPEADLAIVGSINWYDYSWSIDQLRALIPDEYESRLARKRFSRGRHNDANFVRWHHDDASFTRHTVATFQRHLGEALEQVSHVLAVTHHPPFRELNYPVPAGQSPDLDRLLWEAFSGNLAMEDVLRTHADRVAMAFCGHTHFAREGIFADIPGHNVGGDYNFKRLLWVDWPGGTVRAQEFRSE